MAYELDELIVTSDEVNARIQEGIEKNRKGNFTIQTSLQEGEKVQVKLKNHKFRFGANLFMLDEFPDDEKKNGIYKEKFKECFNMATLPFYWDATEPKQDETRYHKSAEKIYRRPPIDLCIEYCEQNGIEPREHALCYDHFFPDWLKDKPVEVVKERLSRRMQEISSRYADKIPTIEVTNEMYWNQGKTSFYDDPEFVSWCFKEAEKYFPNNQLSINEWSGVWTQNARWTDFYYEMIENTLLKGARIDAIAIQYHMFFRSEQYFNQTRRYYDLGHLLKILDNYARLGLPIQISEITIPAYTDLPEDELSQADVIEKVFSAWFSHPSVEQIIYWNLVDGYAAFTEAGNMTDGENYYRGGLLRFDMSEKPAFKRLKKLVREVWTTNETLTVGCGGCVSFRGFYGEYEVTAGGKTVTVSFNADKEKKEI